MTVLVLMAAVITAACADATPGDVDPPDAADADITEAPDPEVDATPREEQGAPEPSDAAVPERLAFTAPAVGGGQVEGAEHAGGAVALWFWAPW